jgi:3-oxoadipate enol-lactonase
VSVREGGGVAEPELPDGRPVDLPRRGVTFVREMPGPSPDAPVAMLVHGWTATADLNWFTCYQPLAKRYRVIALDLRGHGRGIRSRRTFRLEDCADDIAALAEVLGVERLVAVGYSMGGPVVQLLWKRHRELVDALVLCATSPYFSTTRSERLNFLGLTGLAALARMTPARARMWLSDQLYVERRSRDWQPWAIEQVSRHDWRMVLEAGRAIGSFSSLDWVGEIDVPTSVVITMRDEVVPVRRQIRLFEAIHGAEALRVDGGHDVVVSDPDRFVPVLVRALESAVDRAQA